MIWHLCCLRVVAANWNCFFVIYIFVAFRKLDGDRYMAEDIENITQLLRSEKVKFLLIGSFCSKLILYWQIGSVRYNNVPPKISLAH